MKTKKTRRRKNPLKIFLIIILIALSAAAYLNRDRLYGILYSDGQAPIKEGFSQVHFIDVDQGDCELIISESGETFLIDCGEEIYSPNVIGYLLAHNVKRLDYILVTHPHSDHCGGMADIIKRVPEIGTVIIPDVPEEFVPDTRAYERLIDALSDCDCTVKFTETETFEFGDGEISIIKPDYYGDNLNNYSAVLKYTLGGVSFLFSGDLESDMEEKILDGDYDLSADVYKLAHHGSTTSNSLLWLAAISPDYFVCECGAGNPYGHPHREIVSAVEDFGGKLLRTDTDGSIVFETDGKTLEYKTEEQPFWR